MDNILKILYDTRGVYSYDDILECFGFGEGVEISTERKSLLALSPDNSATITLIDDYSDYYKMFLYPEEPNGFFTGGSYDSICKIENKFDLIFGVCKYTKEWREKHFGVDINKRIHTPPTFSEKFIYPNQEKTIPVYFTAHNRPSPILPYIFDAVKKCDGTIVDASRHAPITHVEKMRLNGQSKISITYNLLFLHKRQAAFIMSIPNWSDNEAFKNLHSGLVPQIKTRVFEAAFSKSVILHKFDEWNVIEDWYTPNEDFIYFDGEDDLIDKIHEINKNYDAYKYIAENAYNKAINNYTTKHFIEKYILPNTKLEV